MSSNWMTLFNTSPVLKSFPKPLLVAEESVCSPAYVHIGALRKHESHCFLKFTYGGCGRFKHGKKQWAISSGQGFICRVNDPETAYWYDPTERIPWQFIYFSFGGAEALVRDIIATYGPVFPFADDSVLVATLSRYRRFAGNTIELTASEGALLVMNALAAVVDRCNAAPESTVELELVQEARRIICARIGQPFTMQDLARELHVSPGHLARVFRLRTGKPPHEYLREQKMRIACQMLRDTRMSGKEIYTHLGYATAGHFARAFRIVVGVSPGDFRVRKGLILF